MENENPLRNEKHWTVKNAAQEIGVSHTTLYRWIDKGKVKTHASAGGVTLIPHSQVTLLKRDVEATMLANGGHLPRNPMVGKRGRPKDESQPPLNGLTLAEYKEELAAVREDEAEEHRKRKRR